MPVSWPLTCFYGPMLNTQLGKDNIFFTYFFYLGSIAQNFPPRPWTKFRIEKIERENLKCSFLGLGASFILVKKWNDVLGIFRDFAFFNIFPCFLAQFFQSWTLFRDAVVIDNWIDCISFNYQVLISSIFLDIQCLLLWLSNAVN